MLSYTMYIEYLMAQHKSFRSENFGRLFIINIILDMALHVEIIIEKGKMK